MGQRMINYGIDLGTTNSSISRMEKGEMRIIKTDTLKETLPSCVYINKKNQILVGDPAYNSMKKDKLVELTDGEACGSNSFIEFKRTMGTDKKYFSKNADKEFTSEELSSHILMRLKSFINDDELSAVVVTIPAKFTMNQKDATRRAVELAGFEYCELLQEPIAASMAYGLSRKLDDGYWIVFDFGGGTFDVALVKLVEGIMKVIDTDGDNYLGGKNLDYAIVDEIILKYIEENYNIGSILRDTKKKESLRNAMKYYAEDAKIQLSFSDTYNILSDVGDIPINDDSGEEIELDIMINQEKIKAVLEPIFRKAVNITNVLLKRNNIENKSLDSVILVGGPTYSPILRKMIENEIIAPDASIDPMTVVSKGAALYASTVELPENIANKKKDLEKIQLKLGYEPTTVEIDEFLTIKLEQEPTEDIFVEVVRSDKAWSSGKKKIDTKGEVVELLLAESQPNHFEINVYNSIGNKFKCEPDEFTIIQGSKIGNAILPYNIGVEIKSVKTGKVVFRSVKGLEKNQPIPATGIINGLRTQNPIRPGMKEDHITIPIYQGEYGAEGTRAIYNEHIYDVIISGEDVPSVLPENSEVDITIKIDRSERMRLNAFFPSLDHTHEIDVPVSTTQNEISEEWLKDEIIKTRQSIEMIPDNEEQNDIIEEVKKEVDEIDKRYEQGKGDYDRKKEVLDNLRRALRKIDKINNASEWPQKEKELDEVFDRLLKTQEELGDQESSQQVSQIEDQVKQIKEQKDIRACDEIINQIRNIDFLIVDRGLGEKMEIGMILQLNDTFDLHEWKDRSHARMLIDKGLQLASQGASKDELRNIVIQLFSLLPKSDQPFETEGGDRLVG